MLQARHKSDVHVLQARRKWALKALGHANAQLHFAGAIRGDAIVNLVNGAADALYAASVLMETYHDPLRAAAERLSLWLERIEGPNREELAVVATAAAGIQQLIADDESGDSETETSR